MQDRIDRPVDAPDARHVIRAEREPRIAGKVADVATPPGDEVVDADDLGPVREEPVNQM